MICHTVGSSLDLVLFFAFLIRDTPLFTMFVVTDSASSFAQICCSISYFFDPLPSALKTPPPRPRRLAPLGPGFGGGRRLTPSSAVHGRGFFIGKGAHAWPWAAPGSPGAGGRVGGGCWWGDAQWAGVGLGQGFVSPGTAMEAAEGDVQRLGGGGGKQWSVGTRAFLNPRPRSPGWGGGRWGGRWRRPDKLGWLAL